jgi:GTP-binding protein
MHGAYRQARFLKGVARLSALPADAGAEVAFAGRSNAGKSSVINALTGRASLARISKTPGRTQMLNFFVLDDDRRLVDLPGYGYANVPAAVKRRWAALVEGYLSTRRSLAGVVLLMDARRPFTDADLQLLDWCRHSGVATHVLLNKADKLSRGAGARVLADARKRLAALADDHDVQLFSATRKTGIEELGARLDAWLGYTRADDQD